MKYIIFILGIAIICLRSFGIEIDLISVGLFVIISLIVSLKDLNHLSEFSGFGIRMKFNKELKELSDNTEKIENNIEVKARKEKGLSGVQSTDEDMVDHFEEFLGESEFKPDFSKPKSALIEIAIEIEKTLREISNETLENENKYPIAPRRIISELVKLKVIEQDLQISFEKFWKLRNSVVHGLDIEYKDVQILSLVDSGIRILNILKTVENNIKKGLTVRILS